MDRPTAEKRASQIAQALSGPLGRCPLERVLAHHVPFFSELRADGATWRQIANLLQRVGVTRSNGQPLSEGQIRAAVSRITSSKDQPSQSTKYEQQEITAITNIASDDNSLKHTFPQSKNRNASKSTTSIRERMLRASKARTENSTREQ